MGTGQIGAQMNRSRLHTVNREMMQQTRCEDMYSSPWLGTGEAPYTEHRLETNLAGIRKHHVLQYVQLMGLSFEMGGSQALCSALEGFEGIHWY